MPPEPPALRPFHRYPAKARLQRRIASDAAACHHCLGGTCCTSEDPIGLTPFDVLRLSAFLDLSPGGFLLHFTQDRFADDDDPAYRQPWRHDPDSSVVTWLRRRANSRHSPCLFLRYVHDDDATPRRVCSVHPARPLACREYYHDTCKTRWTGELAALQAQGFEWIRDGRVESARARRELDRAEQNLARSPGSAPALLARAFWLELWRALHPDACNVEGAANFPLHDWQDPLPGKLNRLLSRRHLRREERYGPVPCGDQLQPYHAGTGFAGSPERARLLRLAANPPRTRFFTQGDYPLFVAHRDWLPEAAPPPAFPRLSPLRLRQAVADQAPLPLFPRHRNPALRAVTRRDAGLALLRGLDYLARFAGYLRTLGTLLELAPPGHLEAWLRVATQHWRRHSPLAARHPALEPIIAWTRSQPACRPSARAARHALRSHRSVSPAAVHRWIITQEPDGGWGTRPSGPGIPATQGEYFEGVLWQSLVAIDQLAAALRIPHPRSTP
ncbi:MAG: hypothetical protein KF833_14280 [Verrucomicrobiae bacterium]|nr:hypothetical protein [Verrucomicrobiae bacterium]